MSYTKEELKKALNKAKIDLMAVRNSVFISTVVWSLRQTFSTAVPTAGTNGIQLVINPDWFMDLSREERVGLLAHEAWHVCLEHMVRGLPYDHRIYNIAADYVINIMLQDAGYTLPPHGYVDAQYRNMTTEQVYGLIYEKEQNQPSDYPLDIQMADGSQSDDSTNGGMSLNDIKAKIENIIIKANIQAKMAKEKTAGNIPGEVERRIEELTNPKLPWNVILQNFVNAFAKTDYSYARPKKKFLPDFYLPSLSGSTINHIAIAIDSSGSVYDHEFTQFLQEIDTIKNFCQPNLITIIDFDSDIKATHEVTQDDDLWNIPFHGYGGTNLEPPFQKAREIKPDLFIVFSDLECRAIPAEEEPPFPVIWVAVNNKVTEVNFGQRIDLETSHDKAHNFTRVA